MEGHRTHLLRLLVVVAFGCATASANLVQDYDFELSDLDPEPEFSTHWDASSYLVTPIDVGGDIEAQFAEVASEASTVSLMQQGLGLVEGVTYEVSFDLSISIFEESVIPPECDDFWVYLGQNAIYHWTDEAGHDDRVDIPEGGYQATITTLGTPGVLSGGVYDRLAFMCEFDGGPSPEPDTYQLTRITVDNVSVVPVPLPPGVVLAGLGMMSCGVCGGIARYKARFLGRRKDKLA